VLAVAIRPTVPRARRIRFSLMATHSDEELAQALVAVAEAGRRAGVIATPCGGVYGDYAAVAGIRIPTRAEVSWELADGPFIYWRGRITSLETA